MASLNGRVAIITGAGQGIGRAFAKAFAAEGAIPIIAERSRERGEAVLPRSPRRADVRMRSRPRSSAKP